MGITLETDKYLLYSLFNISPRKISNEYSGKSIEEIMEAEAAQGNAAAANFDREILNNPIKLMQMFKLDDVGNKYAILSNMSEKDLKDLLPLLDPSDMVAGLNFFTKDKLLELVKSLPPEQLVKFVLEMFSPEELMQLMPEEQLNKFLQSTKMDKGMELKFLQSMNPQILAQMLESVTGQPVNMGGAGMDGSSGGGKALLAQIAALPDDKFQEALINIPPQNKRNFILQMTKQDPKLMQLFEPDAYTNIISQRRDKQDMIRSASVIEPEQLIKMLNKLPQDLAAVVMTQIDPKVFADILIKSFKDILSQVIAG